MVTFERFCLTLQPFQEYYCMNMNLYIRYFDDEVVVTSVEDALEFIRGVQGFNVTPEFEKEFREYAESSIPFPKRYKVRPRVYFIVIKTAAATLAEFKANGKAGAAENGGEPMQSSVMSMKNAYRLRLTDECPGWYEGTLNFKRVVINPDTGKYDYKDTVFSAITKAYSPLDCYNRIIEHLHNRTDVDPRSQFPSSKGKNFHYEFLGFKPLSELNV